MTNAMKMFAMNMAIQNILGAFELNDNLDAVADDIEICDNNAYSNMNYWIDRNTVQYDIANIQSLIYHILTTDIYFYLDYKETNPALAQSDIGKTVNYIREYIYHI